MLNNDLNKPNVAVVTHAFSKMGEIFLSTLIKIIEPSVNELFVISGNFEPEGLLSNDRIHLRNVKPVKEELLWFIKILKYIPAQLEMCVNLAKISSNIDIVIFSQGSTWLPLPLLLAKLLRKRVIVVVMAATFNIAEKTYSNTLFGKGGIIFHGIFKLLANISYALSDKIVVYSEKLIDQFELNNYKNKISIAHEHFLDFDKFKIKNKFDERDNLVGYIGRLSEEKGVLNFVRAIPKIFEERDKVNFLVGGDGHLRDEIEKYISKENLNNKVNLAGWIPHDRLPDYLNELKLVVLPSYTEGLPNVMLEAMVCGTPVLATSVGAIPDVIKDGETGFIMGNNTPECIAENVIRVLKHTDIEEIVKNAREFVEKEFTYEAAVERYRAILDNL
jgi:glycosyltransferase involved in cell wall biosynthesis